MLSKNKIKFIRSLSQKKFRDETNCFVAEGTKLIQDMTAVFKCRILVYTKEWKAKHPIPDTEEELEASADEMKKISNLTTSQGVLAVFEKNVGTWTVDAIKDNLSLALDDIQDPGNLGTIIRIADWFGIKDIFCSENTADAYSPKTVQATMGALGRVRVHLVNLSDFLGSLPAQLPVYGTFMDGNNIYSETLSGNGIVVMGNEGNGISPVIEKQVSKKILIPNFPAGQHTSESLNVAVATAIVCAEFRRRLF